MDRQLLRAASSAPYFHPAGRSCLRLSLRGDDWRWSIIHADQRKSREEDRVELNLHIPLMQTARPSCLALSQGSAAPVCGVGGALLRFCSGVGGSVWCLQTLMGCSVVVSVRR